MSTPHRARRFDEAYVHLERALELEPRNISTYVRLVAVLEHTGRYDAATAMVERMKALSAPPAIRASAIRARILARAGRATEARRLLAHVRPDAPLRVEVLAALADPAFESLHGDPRWTAVLRRMNLD